MFLLESLIALTAVYWQSALVAGVTLGLPEKGKPAAPVLVGIGHIAALAWFAAAWKFAPVVWAWPAGVALLIMYSAGTAFENRKQAGRVAADFIKAFLPAYTACIAAGLLFFAPLLISGKFGPFTEGGGDVSVYADVAKYIADRGLSVTLGDPSAIFGPGLDKLANPPTADYAVLRAYLLQYASSLQFSPFGQWFWLEGTTNYNFFYGTMAFEYAITLLAVWSFFRQFTRRSALLAVAAVASSHGLISVFYNLYFLQGVCLMIAALAIASVLRIRLFSAAGAFVYGLMATIVLTSYPHFILVLGPLIAAAWGRNPGAENYARPVSRPVQTVAPAVFAVTLLFWFATEAGSSVKILFLALKSLGSGYKAEFGFGDSVPLFSAKWAAFFSGALSQQHFQPLAVEPWYVVMIPPLAFALLTCAMVCGVAVSLHASRQKDWLNGDNKRLLVLYIVALVVVMAQHLVAKGSMYTQAKGAQNALIPLYAAMFIPYAIMSAQNSLSESKKTLRKALGFLLVAFIAILAFPRVVYLVKIANANDRAGIMEPSFYSEADRIMKGDKNPFVWFEPRKSADLYVSIQPFAGAKMVPTKHLSLDVADVTAYAAGVVKRDPRIASDFLRGEDLSHIWLLTAQQTGSGSRFLGRLSTYEWKAARLTESKAPTMLYAGIDYEPFFGRRPRSAEKNDRGWFTYIRSGAALMYIPAGIGHVVEVKLKPRAAEEYGRFLQEIEKRLEPATSHLKGAPETDGEFVTLRYNFPPGGSPTVFEIARYSGEYWLNARIDGKELEKPLE